jgi:hypothetical protein
MTCKCGSTRIIKFDAKCSDMSVTQYQDVEREGYMPGGIGIGGGDYVEFRYCADCGQIQNFTPLTHEDIIQALTE